MRIKPHIVYPIIAIVLFTATVLAYFYFFRPQPEMVLRGTLFASDAGRSHGGFEYTAEWNATLSLQGSSGILELSLNVGLGDALDKHEYAVTDFVMDAEAISMKLDGRPIVMELVRNDDVWDHAYDNHYIASWGGYAPVEEHKGFIKANYFAGIPDFWYVELRFPAPVS